MSKRFGRNQRRRLREAVEAAEQQTEAACQEAFRLSTAYYVDVTMLQEQLAKARDELNYIRGAAADLVNNGLLPATVVKDSTWPGRWDVTPRGGPVDLGPDDGPALCEATDVDLYQVGLHIESDPISVSRVVHFFCEGQGPLRGQWRYMVSEKMLSVRGLGADAKQCFVKHIADGLFRASGDHFRGQRKTGAL